MLYLRLIFISGEDSLVKFESCGELDPITDV